MIRAVVALIAALAVNVSGAAPAPAEERVSFRSLDADLTLGAPTDLSAVLLRPVGADPKARQDAIRRVTAFFARHLVGGDRR